MVAALAPERSFRGAGCDDRCHVVRALIPGLFGRTDLLIHDAEAHEEYGRRQVVEPEPTVIVTGPLAIDFDRLEVTVDGVLVPLTPTEMKLMWALARRVGRGLTIEQLLTAAWPAEWIAAVPKAHAHLLRVHLTRMRVKLGEAATLIVTLNGLGYRLELVPAGERPPQTARANRTRLDGLWSLKYAACRDCGTTERRHEAHGRCGDCKRQASRRTERRS